MEPPADPRSDAALRANVDAAVHCEGETCAAPARWILIYRSNCSHGQPIYRPAMMICNRCLINLRNVLRTRIVRCAACHCPMESIAHTVESLEKL